MSDMAEMQRNFHRNMAQMQQGVHRDMAQMHRDMAQMQQDMTRRQTDAQRSAHQMQRQAQHHARQLQRQAQDRARQAQREHRNAQRQALGDIEEQQRAQTEQGGWTWPGAWGNSWTFGSGTFGGGVSTSVVNGDVYVNGQLVAQLPPGAPVSIQTVNNVVHLNGEVVWPQQGGDVIQQTQRGRAVMPPPAHAREDERSLAMRYSRVGVCDADREEPCPICLDDIRAGQRTRTLPCFHFLHQHCAESHFSQGENPADAVLCPVCRAEVGPTQQEVEVLSD